LQFLRRAFILPATLALLVLLTIIGAALHYVQNVHATQSRKASLRMAHLQAARLALADFRSALQGEPNEAQLPQPLPAPAERAQSFRFADTAQPDITISGQFNAKSDASIHNPVPTTGNSSTGDLYEPVVEGGRHLPVPNRHSLLLFQTSGNGESHHFAALYSSNWPYGMMAPHGSISLGSVRSVTTHLGDQPEESGLPVDLAARTILISDFFYGHGYVESGGRAQLSPYGLPVETSALPDLPRSFGSLAIGLAGQLGSQGFDLSYAIQKSPWLRQGHFEVPAGFGIYPRENIKVPFDTVVTGNLIVPEDSVLHIAGKLTVGGHIYMGNRSSLLVDGDLQVTDSLDLYQIEEANQGITTTVVAGGRLSLAAGMSQTPGLSAYAQDDRTELGPYLQSFLAPLPIRLDQVGPALLVAGGDIQVGNSNFPTRCVGLLVASQNIHLQGNCQLIGSAFSESGNIDGPASQFNFFPYFTHAFVHSVQGNQPLPATFYHLTAFGEI
jgi:hypothetical protein